MEEYVMIESVEGWVYCWIVRYKCCVMRLCELRYVTSSDSLVARNRSSRLTCHMLVVVVVVMVVAIMTMTIQIIGMTMEIHIENRRLMCELMCGEGVDMVW